MAIPVDLALERCRRQAAALRMASCADDLREALQISARHAADIAWMLAIPVRHVDKTLTTDIYRMALTRCRRQMRKAIKASHLSADQKAGLIPAAHQTIGVAFTTRLGELACSRSVAGASA